MKIRWNLNILIMSALLVINASNIFAEKTWTRRADMPTARYNFGTCVVDGKVFVIGGEIEVFGERSVAIVEVYDPKTDTWERRIDMPTARAGVVTLVVDGKIYAIGGAELKKFQAGQSFKRLPVVEMYDPITDTWTQKADMPALRGGDACVVDGKIYLIGGYSEKQARSEIVDVYDPTTDTWARAKSMNHARSGAAISVVNGKIYVMGGTGWPQIPNHPGPFLSSAEVFDPETDRWTEIIEMPTAKTGHTASVINGKIYVIGGFFWGNGPFMYLSTVEIYDPETDRWTQGSDMSFGRWAHKAAVVNRNIYIFGGNSAHIRPLTTVEVYGTGEVPRSVDPVGKLLETWTAIKTIK